jgi:hypothetical protein
VFSRDCGYLFGVSRAGLSSTAVDTDGAGGRNDGSGPDPLTSQGSLAASRARWRIFLTDERNSDAYDHRLPHTEVEAVVPAYCSFTDADAELGIRPIVEPPAEQRLSPSWIVGWELLVPEDNESGPTRRRSRKPPS